MGLNARPPLPPYDISRALYNDEILFQIFFGHRESVNLMVREMLIAYCFCDFLFYGYPCTKKENMMLYCRKNYGIQFTDKGHTDLGNL